MKHFSLLLCFLMATWTAWAQKLTVDRMEIAPMDLSASTQPRNDLNGKPCALVKVQLATEGATFEGNIVGDCSFRKGEYWVYMSTGAYMLTVKHSNFEPFSINFRDYDISHVEQKTTYVLTLLLPETGNLNVNYRPFGTEVWMDGIIIGKSPEIFQNIQAGSHQLELHKEGYSSVTMTVSIEDGKTFQVNGELTEIPKSEFYGKSANEIAEIARNYYQGKNGKTKNFTEAVKWARKAAEMGNPEAQLLLGTCYAYGEGVEKDVSEAAIWYRKAADQGNAIAQFDMSICYEEGDGVPKDYSEAFKWLIKAAEQGNTMAQTNLGTYYYDGLGVASDTVEAVKWWKKAAEQGIDLAQNNLADHYYDIQDYTEAVKWYRMAAGQGNDYAQTQLGYCYFRGLGVEKNTNEANSIWHKAATQGNENAKYSLKRYFNEE